jgi:flagellar basal-body rod protein FlgB
MSGALWGGTTIPVLERVVGFAQARHSVLAGNIANMDTPGYRVRDLSEAAFASRLRDEIAARDRGETSALAGARGGRRASAGAADDALAGILYHDDSNPNVETQVAELSKNQIRHNLALAILNSQFRQLQAAISERV